MATGTPPTAHKREPSPGPPPTTIGSAIPASPPPLNISITVEAIYASLCPTCQDAFLNLIVDAAQARGLKEVLRAQLQNPRVAVGGKAMVRSSRKGPLRRSARRASDTKNSYLRPEPRVGGQNVHGEPVEP